MNHDFYSSPPWHGSGYSQRLGFDVLLKGINSKPYEREKTLELIPEIRIKSFLASILLITSF